MRMGLVGLSGSGTSTVFSIVALNAGSSAPARPDKPRVACVKVPDPRVDWLAEYYKPEKTTYADVEFIDFAGIRTGVSGGQAFSSAFLGTLRTMDGLLLTLRDFEDPSVFHPLERIDPVADLSFIYSEFLLADLQLVEDKLSRLEKNVRRGMKQDQDELDLMASLKAHLESERPMREMELSEDTLARIKGFAFLTLKPMAVLLNLDEERFAKRDDVLARLQVVAKERPLLALSACIEEEIGQLDPVEQKEFLSDLGLTEPARSRLIKQCFDVQGYITFFTVGEDEVKAWTLRRGQTSVRAASRIHTDLERGYIRAEVFSYDDLRRLGNVPTVKKEGLWRLEGKEYVVCDGDILCIRANV